MILEEIPNPTPMVKTIMAGILDLNTLDKRVVGRAVDFCYCEVECQYEEKAFAKIGGTDFENDTTSFLATKFIPADIITFSLFKNDTLIDIISDDTYGQFFAPGDLTVPENPRSSLYTGFIVEWQKVFTIEGGGIYEIRTGSIIVGSVTELRSHKYRLMEYSDEAAENTVRVKTIQNGNIERLQIDYTGLDWPQSIRVRGKLFDEFPELSSERYEDNVLESQQIQEKLVDSYTLETWLLPRDVARKLIYDNFLANRIFVTDYNIINEDVNAIECTKAYNELELYLTEIEKPNHYFKSTMRDWQFTLREKRQDNRKRVV